MGACYGEEEVGIATLTRGLQKRHVSSMLRHLPDDESKKKALDVAADYRRMFADKKWNPVMAMLNDFANEDHVRVPDRRRPAPLKQATLASSKSAPPAVLDGQTCECQTDGVQHHSSNLDDDLRSRPSGCQIGVFDILVGTIVGHFSLSIGVLVHLHFRDRRRTNSEADGIELQQVHRNRPKSNMIKLPERAVQLAWAVRILEDAERAARPMAMMLRARAATRTATTSTRSVRGCLSSPQDFLLVAQP